MDDPVQTPGGSARFDVTITGDRVIKRGDPPALAREAMGQRRAAGRDLAPDLLHAGRGVVISRRVNGVERNLDGLSPSDARALGRALRRLHDVRTGASGGLPRWHSRARSLTAYRRRRAADALVAATGADRAVAARVVAGLPDLPNARAPRPFRFLHGDLVAANILWTPAPRLVDFEFWRMGDPAEDLAYLIEVNELDPSAAAAVLDGYGDAAVTDRVDAWRALSALDAGLWYRANCAPSRAGELIARAGGLVGDLNAPPGGRRPHERRP